VLAAVYFVMVAMTVGTGQMKRTALLW